MERAVKLGCVKTTDAVNLINVQHQCSTKVTVTEGSCDMTTVECDGGLKVSGRVLGGSPVLSQVTSEAIGMVELSGCVIVAKGTTLTQIVQEVQGISEVLEKTDTALSLSLPLSHAIQSFTCCVL